MGYFQRRLHNAGLLGNIYDAAYVSGGHRKPAYRQATHRSDVASKKTSSEKRMNGCKIAILP